MNTICLEHQMLGLTSLASSELHGKDTYLKDTICQFRLVHKPCCSLTSTGSWVPNHVHYQLCLVNVLWLVCIFPPPPVILCLWMQLPSKYLCLPVSQAPPPAIWVCPGLGQRPCSHFPSPLSLPCEEHFLCPRFTGWWAPERSMLCLLALDDLIHNRLTWSLSLKNPKPLPPGSSLRFQLPAKISNSPLSPKLSGAIKTHYPIHSKLLFCSRTIQSFNKWSGHARCWSVAVTRSQLPLQVMDPCHQLANQPVGLARTPSLLLHGVLLPIMPCSKHSNLHCLTFHHCSQEWPHGSGLCFCKTWQLPFLPLIWPPCGVKICLHTYLFVQVTALHKIL